MTKMRTRTQNKISDENSNLKGKLDSKITKQKRSRQVLADRTNSGSDLNNSSPKQECTPKLKPKQKPTISTARPKRTHQLPSRFKDHELSPVQAKKKNVQSTSTPLPTLPPTDNSYKMIQKLSPINEPTMVRTKKVSKVKTVERDKVSSNIPKTTTPSLKKFFTSNQSIKCSTPIYKKKISGNVQIDSDKLALYEFEFDPKNEPATVTKKKRQKRVPNNKDNPKKRKKTLSRKSTEAAMKMLISDIKKIQAENMMKKLVSKINSKKIVEVVTEKKNPTVSEAIAQADEVEDVMDCSSPSSPINFDAVSAEDDVNKDNEDEFLHNPMSSTRLSNKPIGSPWRMDLDSDVKKWRYNFYVKPSMTPAYERDTFHVLGLDDKEVRKEVQQSAVATSTPNVKNATKFKQTSILSFYEESFKKSPRKKVSSPKKNTPVKYNFDEYSQDESNDAEVISEPIKETIVEPNLEQAIENCFGFDDDISDQENISPTKTPADLNAAKRTLRKLRNRRAPVLIETNQMLTGPARITTHQVKSILRREKKQASPKKTPAIDEVQESVMNTQSSDDSDDANTAESVPENTVALFEDLMDVNVVHHVKVYM